VKRQIVIALGLTAALAAAALVAVTCASLKPEEDALAKLREALAAEAGPLERAAAPQTGPYVTEYFANADRLEPGYVFPGTRLLGTVDAAGYRLGVVLLLPPTGVGERGTIIAWHGYAGYSAFNLPFLYRLSADGWPVLAVDLPGHGFSSGPSADIGDFSEYGACVNGVKKWMRAQTRFAFPRPLVLLGHSTGGSAVLESLWQDPAGVDRAVLLAPLLEPNGFWFTSSVAGCAGTFASGGPMPGPRQGYLSPYEMPFSWVKALGRWRDALRQRPPLALPILVVQGDHDKTLDWKAGLADLKRIAPDAEVKVLAGRGHTLLDRGPAQAETLEAVRVFLEENR
jgi:alpha-beta hydrolase superfamily lysophospholipase